ncbi:MAG TPA: sigma-70 family RNA polymerase sigma factor [Polyangiaceae bacterium]|nr:sigma-70 family RNA polymerase sigma factor [Polyangiaceae bacterium]
MVEGHEHGGGSRDRAEVEAALRTFHAAGDYSAVATLALRHYGPEVLGFLVAVRRDRLAAGEIFSQFCEDLWAGLPRFGWASSFRTWAYALARHALVRHGKDPFGRRRAPLSEHPGLSALEQQVRTQTLPYLRTEVKQRAALLRQRLEPDEQTLLVLRVDRGLGWAEIAMVMAEGGEAPADAARAAAALRKRFERVKAKLKALLEQEGLLGEA